MPEFNGQPTAQEGIFNNLRGNIQNIGNVMLQKKLQEQQQREKIRELIQEALLKGKIAKSGRTDYLTSGGDVNMDAFQNDPLYDLERKGKVADAEMNIYKAGGPAPSMFNGGHGETNTGTVLGRQPNGGVNLEPDKYDEFGRPTSFVNPARESQSLREKEIIKGPAESAVGKIALANESLKNLEDIKKILFPTGKANSFKRELAFRSNMPGISLPVLGRLTPQVSPDNPLDPTDDTKSMQAQDLFRKMGASLSGRQLIQTGVAARPEETQKLVGQFAPGLFSNPDSSFRGLDELKDFYRDYLNNAEPSRRLGKNNQPSGQNQSTSFASEEDVEAAGLPDGTPIIVNGRRAIYRR